MYVVVMSPSECVREYECVCCVSVSVVCECETVVKDKINLKICTD